ncbi:hypothetical protein C0J52_02051 [Blattella germanica]|nr:hypothetical protein C0J52_02051 [Blattella germanica]
MIQLIVETSKKSKPRGCPCLCLYGYVRLRGCLIRLWKYNFAANLDEKEDIMIAASEPQEFVPYGRQQVKRHPGEVVLPSTQPQLHPESFLLHRLSQVTISDTADDAEWWCINNNNGTEEELYVKGKTAVWSRGVNDSGVVVCCYTCETPVKHALWCTFHTSASDRPALDGSLSEEPKGGQCLELQVWHPARACS